MKFSLFIHQIVSSPFFISMCLIAFLNDLVAESYYLSALSNIPTMT